MSERQHQVALFSWANAQEAAHPELRLLYASTNGAHLGGNRRYTGWRMKQEGMKPGVPDVCLPVARGSCHGLYIELKNDKPKGVLSPEQRAWIAALADEGYLAEVCYGWLPAKDLIMDYLTTERLL